MGQYILRRLLFSIPILIGVTLVVYMLVDLAPGDAVTAMIMPGGEVKYGEEWMERERERLGLNKPWGVRYALWVKEAATGNLGYSFVTRKPVAKEMFRVLPNTLKLAFSALIFSTVLGVIVGVVGGVKQYSLLDHILSLLSFSALSIPTFFFCLLLVYFFALQLDFFPTGGLRTEGSPGFWDSVQHMILPVLALGLPLTAGMARYVRSSVLDVLHMDFVLAARAKGIKEHRVITKHVLRNSLLPVVTIIGMRIPILIAGSVVVEYVFVLPGLGQMGVQSVLGHDFPMVMGFNLVIATIVIISNLITDISYAFLDPRIRFD